MLNETDKKELRILARAFASTAFVLWGVFPMHVLGWLVSAIARHPSVENELKGEPVYAFMLFWQGGINALPPVFLLILLFLTLFSVSFWLRKSGYAHPEDGLSKGRVIVRTFLIPSFISAYAFAAGVMSGDSLRKMLASSVILVCFALVAGVFRYFTDTTEEL